MPDAIDLSLWTAVPTPQQLQCLKANGVRLAIVGTRGNREPHFRAQVIACRSAGLAVEAYTYLYFAESAQLQAADALKKMAGLGIPRVWMDVEGVPQGAARTVAALEEVERAFVQRGYRVGIYTSLSKWPLHTGNTTRFRGFPLWDAHWRYDAGDARGINQPPLAFVRYGGWSEPAIVQYVGEVTYCGLNLDLNMVYEQEDVMSPLVWTSEVGGRLYFCGELPPRWITDEHQARILTKIYGLPRVSLTWGELYLLGAR